MYVNFTDCKRTVFRFVWIRPSVSTEVKEVMGLFAEETTSHKAEVKQQQVRK